MSTSCWLFPGDLASLTSLAGLQHLVAMTRLPGRPGTQCDVRPGGGRSSTHKSASLWHVSSLDLETAWNVIKWLPWLMAFESLCSSAIGRPSETNRERSTTAKAKAPERKGWTSLSRLQPFSQRPPSFVIQTSSVCLGHVNYEFFNVAMLCTPLQVWNRILFSW